MPALTFCTTAAFAAFASVICRMMSAESAESHSDFFRATKLLYLQVTRGRLTARAGPVPGEQGQAAALRATEDAVAHRVIRGAQRTL